MPRKLQRKDVNYCKIKKRGSFSPLLVKNCRAVFVGRRAGSSTSVPSWKMDLRSPSSARESLVGDKGKDGKMSARRLAANHWEINGLKSPGGGGGGGENESFQEEDRKRLAKSGELFEAELGHTHMLNQSFSPVCKNKDGSYKMTRHRRKSSTNSQKFQPTEYLGGEGIDSVINGAFEAASPNRVEKTSTIKTRLKDVSSSLAGSKEIVKALFRLWSQEGQVSSRLSLVSALRVEIEQARHQVDQLIHEELYNESDTKTLLRQFLAEKVAWKRREQDRIYEAISSVSKELEIEKKLRRQSERLNKRLGRELADTTANLSKVVKKLERERRAREILEQTYDELVKGLGEERGDVSREARYEEEEEKNAAIERLRSDLEVYLGGKQTLNDNGSVHHDDYGDVIVHQDDNGERERKSEGEGEEDSDDSDLNSIELSVDSRSKSYKWSFANEGATPQVQDDSTKASADEVFKGRRSLSEKVQWENICLQRKTSDGTQTKWDYNNSRKLGNVIGFDMGSLAEVSGKYERDDHKPMKGCKELLGSRGSGQSCTGSTPESPFGRVSQGSSKRFNVNSGDQFDGNGGRASKR